MGVLFNRGLRLAPLCALIVATIPVLADEIRLKDGKKLYGVIVAYEENMFKVKTDFGYVLVEKDKIASIIPTAPTSPEAQPAGKSADPTKNGTNGQPKAETSVPSPSDATPPAANASANMASLIDTGRSTPSPTERAIALDVTPEKNWPTAPDLA